MNLTKRNTRMLGYTPRRKLAITIAAQTNLSCRQQFKARIPFLPNLELIN
jgi:hypothetical protein